MRVVCAIGFAALVVHTLIYASFLEDPLTWVLLGLAAALRSASAPTPPQPAAS